MHARAQTIPAAVEMLSGHEVEALACCLRDLLGHLGDGAFVKPKLPCDCGVNISVGARSLINGESVLRDCNTITIGEKVQIGPGAHIYTGIHRWRP